MNSVFTIDHRYGDASLGMRFINIIKKYVEDPENFDIDSIPATTPYN